MKQYTPEEIKNNHSYIKNELNKQSYFVRENIIQKLVDDYNPIDVLEIGGGNGFLSNIIKKKCRLKCVDIDDYQSNMDVQIVDVSREKLPFNNSYFDLVIASALVEHLENPFFFKREVARVLKQNGKLIVSIPNIFNLRSKLSFLFKGNVKGYNKHNNHIALFTKDIFHKLFLGDFTIEKVRYSRGYIKVFNKKIIIPINSIFGDKVLFVLKKT